MKTLKYYTALITFIPIALAADCFQPRPSNDPAATDLLANFVTGEISQICTGGQSSVSTIPVNGYVFYLEAADGVRVDGLLCSSAFSEIVVQCIIENNFFGGSVVSSDAGQLFNLTNARIDDISPALAIGAPTGDGSGSTVPPPPPPPPPPTPPSPPTATSSATPSATSETSAPPPITFQMVLQHDDSTGCSGTAQSISGAIPGDCVFIGAAGFQGINVLTLPTTSCQVELFTDTNCADGTELPIQDPATAGSCVSNIDVPAAQSMKFSC